MDLDPKLLTQLLDAFHVELEDQLQVITDGLLSLERQADDDDRHDVLHQIFRAAHNIKGSARAVDVSLIADLAHRMESIFAELKENNTTPQAEVFDLCLEVLDAMREAMRAFDENREVEFDPNVLFKRLDICVNALLAEVIEDLPEDTGSEPDTEMASAVPQERAEQAELTPDDSLNNQALVPNVPVHREETISGNTGKAKKEAIRVAIEKLDGVGGLAEELQVAKIGLVDQYECFSDVLRQVDALNTLWTRSGANIFRDLASLPDSVRQLLHASKSAVESLHRNANRTAKDLRSTANRIGFISTALQSDLRMLRLVPAATVIRPLMRTIRDIARGLNKQVEVHISGDEIEMDRAVLEGIRDPMVHLLRNAIDHGIESVEERRAANKPEVGAINIEISSAGGQISISLSDDGRGIDPERIGEVALRKKLISKSQLEQLDEAAKLDLIFLPGFSSKEIITDVSGRGVGLDVVRTNLRNLKGNVTLKTERGRGTSFQLQVPLTLTTERGLHVRAGGEELVIPSTSVERTLFVDHKDVVHVEARQAIILDGRPIPLQDLGDTLELRGDQKTYPEQLPVVVVSKGWRAVALIVEEVIGEREIVVKRLRPPLLSVRNTSGATLTGDGGIVMVLNAGDLVESALKTAGQFRLATQDTAAEEQHKPSILVVDDSITTRTLERNILEAHGYEVTIAVDGKKAWETLQKQLFDLIVTDIEMPLMDGFALTEKIKQSEDHSTTPVIIVSSLSNEKEKQRGIDVGADAYIVKGEFETKALMEVVQQLI